MGNIIAATSDDLRAQFTIRYNLNEEKKKKKLKEEEYSFATKNNLVPRLYSIPHTHVTLFPCPIHLSKYPNSSRSQKHVNDDSSDDMAHSQVYDLPTNVRTSGCPSLHGNFDVRAVMATHRNKQTDSRRFLFWRHLIEK